MATTATPISNLTDLDKRSIFHPFTVIAEHLESGPHVIDRAEGIYLWDVQGRQYLDAMAGLWCVNAGYGRPEIVDAIRAQSEKLSYYHSFLSSSNEPAIRLADRLLGLAPGRMSKVFFCNSGSEANDTNIKLVWFYNNLRGKPEKKKIISRKRAFHGVTLGAASMSGLPPMHGAFDLPLDRFLHVETPHYFWNAALGETEEAFSVRLAKELEDTILREGPETVAAFIAEPVMGAAGVVPPPKGYFEAIVPVLRKYDVLFIIDEVICGFGRLGEWFGSFKYGLEPDLMTVAKGLTSGYVPMAASLISGPVWDVLREGSKQSGVFAHGFTYTGHPLAAAAALANLDLIERDALVGNAAAVGQYFQRGLRERFTDHPLVGEVRGLGLIAGIELVADKAKKTAFDPALWISRRMLPRLMDVGLVCRPIGSTLTFSPPLVLTKEDADEIMDRFARALDAFAGELRADGTWRT